MYNKQNRSAVLDGEYNDKQVYSTHGLEEFVEFDGEVFALLTRVKGGLFTDTLLNMFRCFERVQNKNLSGPA